MAIFVSFVRISNGQLISSADNMVASNESLRVVIGAGKPNYTYKLRRNGVNLIDLPTGPVGGSLGGGPIFIPGVSAGTYTYDVRDIAAQMTEYAIDMVVTGGTGGGGGMSKWMLIGLAVAGFFLLKGGKKLKW